MEIIEYQKKYKQDFIDINVAWVKKYFVMEQADRDTLYHAEEYLEKGGMIFFAVENGKVLATGMTYPHTETVWEITKLGADEKYQGRGAGSAVLRACMDFAANGGAEKIFLETNHVLKPAQHLYEKFGFQRTPLDPGSKYARADVRFEYAVRKGR